MIWKITHMCLSIFLCTINTFALCPAVVCTCALPKTSNPLFPKWQSQSGPGCWFCGLIIKDNSVEVWPACDGFSLILTEGRGTTWWFEPGLKHFSASELLQCEDSSAWLMLMYYSQRCPCFPFMLKENISMETVWRLWTPCWVFEIHTASSSSSLLLEVVKWNQSGFSWLCCLWRVHFQSSKCPLHSWG